MELNPSTTTIPQVSALTSSHYVSKETRIVPVELGNLTNIMDLNSKTSVSK